MSSIQNGDGQSNGNITDEQEKLAPKIQFGDSRKRRSYTTILNIYYDTKLLTVTEKVVYFFMHRHAGAHPENKAWPKQERLAQRIGMSVRLLKATLQRLKEKGFLKWERPYFGGGNIYTVLEPTIEDADLW